MIVLNIRVLKEPDHQDTTVALWIYRLQSASTNSALWDTYNWDWRIFFGRTQGIV